MEIKHLITYAFWFENRENARLYKFINTVLKLDFVLFGCKMYL